MGEAADEERLRELNRNKERYEQMEEERRQGHERELADEARENQRRLQLQRQKDEEERERKREVEASASRIAAGKEKYRREEAERRKNVARLKDEAEKQQTRQEVENSAPRIAAARKKYREDQDYRKNAPLKTQILDAAAGTLGMKTSRDYKEPKQVKPINTLGDAIVYKTKQRLGEAKDSFLADMARPAKSINEGRKIRAQRDTILVDPFMQAAPPRRKRSRRSDARAPIRPGTGFLFTEGFMNPPARRTGRRKKGGSSQPMWL